MFFDDDEGDFTPKGAAGGYVKQFRVINRPLSFLYLSLVFLFL